jgi:hypothetical protein
METDAVNTAIEMARKRELQALQAAADPVALATR